MAAPDDWSQAGLAGRGRVMLLTSCEGRRDRDGPLKIGGLHALLGNVVFQIRDTFDLGQRWRRWQRSAGHLRQARSEPAYRPQPICLQPTHRAQLRLRRGMDRKIEVFDGGCLEIQGFQKLTLLRASNLLRAWHFGHGVSSAASVLVGITVLFSGRQRLPPGSTPVRGCCSDRSKQKNDEGSTCVQEQWPRRCSKRMARETSSCETILTNDDISDECFGILSAYFRQNTQPSRRASTGVSRCILGPSTLVTEVALNI